MKNVMRETWRWFGPQDRVSVTDARQAGAQGLVSSLYHVPPGQIWSMEAIRARQTEASINEDGSDSGISWEIIESLPVSEDIKTQSGHWREHVSNWIKSLENIAACGLQVVCYNFMPVLDWTRTNHRQVLAHGGTAMSFDLVNFAVFDIHILKRRNAVTDFTPDIAELAAKRAATMDDAAKTDLADAIIAGLAGAVESWTIKSLKEQLDLYRSVDTDTLRRHHFEFLEQVVPTAERLGIRLCCHPDDPPFSLLGLPKVMSTEDDYARMTAAVDSPANGITLCVGSLGSREDNDLVRMIDRLGSKIFFAHLRNVTRYHQGVPTGFLEDNHLGGDIDMVEVVRALLNEQHRRRSAGRVDWQIPFRPDHGHDLLNDLSRGARPGYPAIGRLKGLAEIRGVMHALA